MPKVISVINQKGGVGKTTTTVNLAAALGAEGHRILVVDIDPQGNATSGLGINKRGIEKSVYEALIGTLPLDRAVWKTEFKNLDIVPSSLAVAGAEIEMIELTDRQYRLRDPLVSLKQGYDFVLIDCPPSLGLLTLNALIASDTILVPIQCEFYALEGLSQLMNTVRQVKKNYNDRLEVEGVLMTMYDSRLNLTVQVANEVKKFFGPKVYRTTIPRNVRLSEAPSYGRPVMYYDRTSKGAKAYNELALEFLKRQ